MNGTWHRQRAFVAAFALGTVLIVGVREAFPGLGGALFAAFACSAIIVGGALIYYQKDSAAATHAADDFYYVGLLFTLVSLIHVLIRIFVFGDTSNEDRTQQLIGNFGIALISTVVGIVARVVLLSLDSPSDATDNSAPHRPLGLEGGPPSPNDRPDDLLRLRDQMRQAIDALSHFTRVTLAQAHDTKSHTERLIHEFNERIDRLADGRLSALDSVASQWEQTAQTIQDQISSVAAKADQQLAAVVSEANDGWQQVAEHAKHASEVSQIRVEAAAELSAKILDGISTVQQALPPLAKELSLAAQSAAALTAASDDAESNIAKAAVGIRDAGTQMQSSQLAATAELSKLQDVVVSLSRALSPLGDCATTTAGSLSALRPAASETESAVRQLRQAVGEVDDLLAGTVDAITTAGKTFESSLAAMIDHLDEQLSRPADSLSNAVDALTDSIRQQQSLAEQNARKAQELLNQIAEKQAPEQTPRWLGIGPRRPQ